jgi:hypothetical protein
MANMVHLLVDARPDYRSWDEDGRPIGEHPGPWWGLMACGMRQLAEGHKYVDDTAAACLHVNCPTCLPECEQLGTPISQLTGDPRMVGHPSGAYERFVAISESWGY